jgi:hypothetical protein
MTKAQDSVLSKIRTARSYCKPWHDSIIHWRKLYDLSGHYSGRKKVGEVQYKDPTYTNTVDLAVGILLANALRWRVFGWSPTSREMTMSSSIEKYLTGLMYINRLRESRHLEYEMFRDFTRDGACVIYSVWDKALAHSLLSNIEVMDDEDATQVKSVVAYTEPPIRVQMIDALQMSMLPGGPNRWSVVVRDQDTTVYDVEAEWGVQLDEYRGSTEAQKLQLHGKLTDYWEHTYEIHTPVEPDENGSTESYRMPVVRHAVLFEESEIIPLNVATGYTSHPYTFGFFKPVGDIPADWGHSILAPLEESVELLERAINRRQRQIDLYSSLPLVSKTQTGRPIQLDPGLGTILTLNLDEDLAFPIWPGNSPDVNQQIEYFRFKAQQSGFSDMMYGSGASQTSGYALSQMGDQNRIRLEQPIAHIEMMLTEWAKKVLDLTRTFARDKYLRVYGKAQGAEFLEEVNGDLPTSYMLSCTIRPEFPNEKVRNHAMATQVKGILSDSRIMETYLGVEQPDDERDRKLTELAEMHPLMQKYTLLAQFKKMADEEDDPIAKMVLNEIMQQQQAAQMQAQGSNPVQPLGTQGSDGTRTRDDGADPGMGNPAGSAPSVGMSGEVA